MQDEDKSKEQLITELRELRKRVAELDLVGKRQVRTSATDITERAKQTREIEHLNRLYSVLSRVSQAVVRATSPETFLEQACREIVEAGGFLLAWIGQVELMTNAVVPKAFWGGIGEYVQGITVYADSRPEGLGPTGTCIREHYPVVHNDFLHDPQTLPWHDRAAPFGIASAAAFPIERAGGVWGALTIYSDEVDRFGGEDAKLLEKVADDIEFALDNLDREFRRKQAEEALLESENKFKSFAEQAITGINIIQDGVFKYVNPKCAQMFGYSVEECLNDMPFKNLVYAEDLAEVEEQIRRRTSGETESVHYTFRGLKKNGQIFPMEIYGSAIVYKGRPAATGTILDITERKRAEEALRKSEGKYRQIVETANEGICMADVDYLFTYVNQKMADMLGYLPQEIIGKPLAHFLFPEDLADHREKRAHRFQGLSETYERRFRRNDGTECWTNISVTVMRNEDGGFRGSFAMLTDITERKLAEEALQNSHSLLAATLESTADGILVVDAAGKVTSFNRNFLELWRIPEALIETRDDEQLLQFVLDQLLVPDAFLDKVRALYQSADASCSDELVFKDGRIFERYSQPQRIDDTIVGRVWSFRDITGRKRAEEERRSLEDRLQRAEKMEALGTLAGGVAHDLNNVLGIVVGYSELLANDSRESSSARSRANEILKGGQRAAAIVQDLLTLARRGVSNRKVLNLNHIVLECRNSPEFAGVFSYHPNTRIETDLEEHLLNISGSAVHLGKSLMNLVSNAAEAMPEGGAITIKTRNRYLDKPVSGYDEVREGDYVVLSVSDTGEGIPPGDLKRIFEPFYTKKVMGRSGTGLGTGCHLGYSQGSSGIYQCGESGRQRNHFHPLCSCDKRGNIPGAGCHIRC